MWLGVRNCNIHVLILLVLLCLAASSAHYIQLQNNTEPATRDGSASANSNCTESSINDFPDDLFDRNQRRQGAVLLHAFFCLYCFLLTAYICNDYLLPAIDCICADFNISADVAGATFLATASCFPELFVNVIGTFLTESDLGVGTVVGSAVFNTFVTPACGALAAKEGIKLKWHILSRDCIIYVISVGALVLVMWDGMITWYEATSLLLLFASYFTLLFFTKKISKSCILQQSCFKSKQLSSKNSKIDLHKNEVMSFGTYRPYFHGELVVEYRNSMSKSTNLKPGIIVETSTTIVKEVDIYVEPESIFDFPKEAGLWKIFWYFFTWPLKFMLFITIPDIRHKRMRSWYPVTFIMCISWIAVSSYLVSWMTTVVGDTIGISDSIMGITFLAAGGNMPELVSIVILSRQGHGDMAMSNTLGSNTLDILLCLGLPWTIKTAMTGNNVNIISGALAYSIVSIIICVIGFYVVTAFYGFKLNLKVGVACLFMYALFLVVATLLELYIFVGVSGSTCQ